MARVAIRQLFQEMHEMRREFESQFKVLHQQLRSQRQPCLDLDFLVPRAPCVGASYWTPNPDAMVFYPKQRSLEESAEKYDDLARAANEIIDLATKADNDEFKKQQIKLQALFQDLVFKVTGGDGLICKVSGAKRTLSSFCFEYPKGERLKSVDAILDRLQGFSNTIQSYATQAGVVKKEHLAGLQSSLNESTKTYEELARAADEIIDLATKADNDEIKKQQIKMQAIFQDLVLKVTGGDGLICKVSGAQRTLSSFCFEYPKGEEMKGVGATLLDRLQDFSNTIQSCATQAGMVKQEHLAGLQGSLKECEESYEALARATDVFIDLVTRPDNDELKTHLVAPRVGDRVLLRCSRPDCRRAVIVHIVPHGSPDLDLYIVECPFAKDEDTRNMEFHRTLDEMEWPVK